MHVLSSTDELRDLIEGTFENVVSLIMPTIEKSREVEQNRIRFKNLTRQAMQQLVQRGMSEKEAAAKLQPLSEKCHDEHFWQHQSQGLAAYLIDDEATYHSLLHSPDELVTIGDGCYLTPLAVDISLHQRVLVLALTWDKAHLYELTDTTHTEVEDDRFPVALRDLLLPPDAEAQLQFRTQPAAVGSDIHYHGQGAGEGMLESDRRLYLSEVGKRLEKAIEQNQCGVVLAATEEVSGNFFAHSNFHAQSKAGERDRHQVIAIRLSPANLTEEQLSERVRHELKQADRAMSWAERLGTATAHGTATRDLAEALQAAASGRVEQLIFRPGQRVWGVWDEEQSQAQVLGAQHDPDQRCVELVNLAIIKTWQTGGYVTAVSDMSLGLAPLAAFFRY